MPYWLRWTLVSGIGLFLGLSAAALLAIIGFGFSLSTTGLDTPVDWALALLSMIPAGIALGVIGGSAQWHELKERFPTIGVGRWIFFTAVAATVALWLGSAMALPIAQISPRNYSTGLDSTTIARLSSVSALLSGGALGMAIGVLFGFFQWLELRRIMHAFVWIWANMIAWGIALTVILALTSSAEIYWPLAAVASIALGSLIIAGVNGIVLISRRQQA